MPRQWKSLLKEYGLSSELITLTNNCIMKFFVHMFKNLKHTWKQISTLAKNVDCKLQQRFVNKYEDSKGLPTAIRGIQKIANDRISEINRGFPKTSEYFPTVKKVLGLLQGIRKLEGDFSDYKLHSESCDYRDCYLSLSHNYFKINRKHLSGYWTYYTTLYEFLKVPP